ncbi:DNA-binding transcriptional MerR regulator [Actinoplanes tereljensis]|uniref:MerR family transcriptional regulator n=1 Tax=Paractinoplanes tereljensis TaxID=571912 RepID=A0A919NI35_9ACTN|nr:MerR family transcriptional regulator [Actinoplanes tereljensis]GIF18332.1 MerR family transcriptional regulator [Actinoplanes tereljensis]
MTTATLSIGEFARRAGLTTKVLRAYDESGLLRPASVDPLNSYRRYHPDQLERARRLSVLRRLEMPLAIAAEILDAPDVEAVLRLDRWWAAEEAAMQARRGSFSWLRGRLVNSASSVEASYTVRVRDVPAFKIASIRTAVDQNGLVEAIRDLEWAIRSHLHGWVETEFAEHWVIFHGPVTPESEATIEVCIPFTGVVEPLGEITIRLEAAHREAYATVARDDCFYPRIMRAYQAVDDYVSTQGLQRIGPEREIYLDEWHRIAGTDPFVHVAIPIEE